MGLLGRQRQRIQRQAKKRLDARRQELGNFYERTKGLSFDEISELELDKFRSIFKANTSGLCWNCKKETHYIDQCFQAWICSPECQDIKNKEFFEELRKSNERFEKSKEIQK